MSSTLIREEEEEGCQAYVYARVLWPSYLMWRSYKIVGTNDLLAPMTPNDPRLTFDPTKKIDGLKLKHMCDFHDYST